MKPYEILGVIAGFNPAYVLPPTGPEQAYRVQIPGLTIDIPIYWSEHMRRLGREES